VYDVERPETPRNITDDASQFMPWMYLSPGDFLVPGVCPI